MFAGHLGAALAIGRAERRINLGVLVFAAFFLDAALWLFVLLRCESVSIPANFETTHQPQYSFPFSHSLVAGVGWASVAGAIGFLCYSSLASARFRGAVLIAAAVFSHWLLDLLVHVAEMPLVGNGSPKVGLGLWRWMPAALLVEAFLTGIGLCLFLYGSRLSQTRKLSLTGLTLLVLVLTVFGMTVAPSPPSAGAMALSSVITIAVVSGLMAWAGKGAG